MITATDLLGAIARDGASRFGSTALAASHSPVTRRVRRHRATRAAVTTVAGVGTLGAGAWLLEPLLGDDAPLAPATAATSDLPSVSPPASPAPPSPVARTFTVIEGRTTDDVAALLAEIYGISETEAREALTEFVQRLLRETKDPEGWVAPGTYDLSGAPTVTDAVELLVGARWTELTELGVPEEDWQRVLTVASLVEREAKLSVDQPLIASVIENRLAAGMRLELDSTIKFIAPSEGVFTTDADRAIDSPYNTYTSLGLPPGPICSPSIDAIRAALEPAQTDSLFFVTINLATGETAYASTFEGHQANVALLQEWIVANGEQGA